MSRELAMRFAARYRHRGQPMLADVWETWARRLP